MGKTGITLAIDFYDYTGTNHSRFNMSQYGNKQLDSPFLNISAYDPDIQTRDIRPQYYEPLRWVSGESIYNQSWIEQQGACQALKVIVDSLRKKIL
jgi:hypothetical protein